MLINTTKDVWYVRGPLAPDCANPRTYTKASARKVCSKLGAGHEIVRISRVTSFHTGQS